MSTPRDGWRPAGLVLALALAASPAAAASYDNPDWTQSQAPFRIVDNVYYVGSKGLAAYLITSPQGHVLLDGTVVENVPMIERNIQALGFRLRDVKILVNSHAHYDHAAGLAQLKRDTGARMLASAGDRWSLEHGRHFGDNVNGLTRYPPVKVDATVADRETVRLGSIALTAVMTPGHTPGCTSWLLPVREGGAAHRIAFPCSLTVAGNVLVGNRAYPGIVADYRKAFARLRMVDADIVLTAHPEFADVLGRHRRQEAGAADAFVDRSGLATLVAAASADFDKELAQAQRKPANPGQAGVRR